MDTKPHWHHAAEHVIECLERYTTMMDPECTCGLCPECGKIPADCSGTECAKTCQCSPCDHCMATWAIAGLRDAMVTPNAADKPTGAACRDRSA